MKNNIRLAGKAEAYYQVCAAIASLEKRKEELTADIKAIAHVTSDRKQRELLTPKYRVLVSWIKRCKVPEHWRKGHSKITGCDIRPEWIVQTKGRQVTVTSSGGGDHEAIRERARNATAGT